MSKIKVYIAGPYTKGDVCANVANSMTVCHDLMDHGFAPYCPHLTHFLHLHKQRPYKEWLAYDSEWLKVCDVLIRLPGESTGADLEKEWALELNIPVYYSLGKFYKNYC